MLLFEKQHLIFSIHLLIADVTCQLIKFNGYSPEKNFKFLIQKFSKKDLNIIFYCKQQRWFMRLSPSICFTHLVKNWCKLLPGDDELMNCFNKIVDWQRCWVLFPARTFVEVSHQYTPLARCNQEQEFWLF